MHPKEPLIDNPVAVSRHQIDAILDRGWIPTIQFSKPGQQTSLLRSVNELAAHYGERLHIRFYGHYSDIFDAAILADLPDVRWLSVDRLMEIRNARCIGEAPKLKKLSFGVYRFADDGFLNSLPLERLTELAVWETDRQTLDLAPLARARAVERLTISGHKKGIAVIASLPELTQLELWRMPRNQDLAFLGQAPSLRELRLLLGGRTSFEEFSHPGLEALTIEYVQGLSTIGPLERFPQLRLLEVRHQGLLRTIDLAGVSLEKLVIMDCKNLEVISDLTAQGQLRELRIARTKIPLDPLLRQVWPPSLSVVGLYNRSQRWNVQARAILDARGYSEYAFSQA
jgi:hypothetical protein